MKDKEIQTIKDLYKDLLEVAKLNHPDYYMMPKTFYNSIVSRLQYVETEFKLAKKARDNWRKKYEELKK